MHDFIQIHAGDRARILMLVLLVILFSSRTLDAHTIATEYEIKPIPLLVGKGPIVLDHLAYDRSKDRVWVPASNTGNVDVIDGASDTVSHIGGFTTAEIEMEGHKVRLGPTAASIGESVVYVGNRGDSTLCVIDSATLARGECVPVPRSSPEGDTGPHAVVYIAATKEVWVTTGLGKSIHVFDASNPREPKFKTTIKLDGSTEGSAIDNERGRFYTNIGDAGSTIAIDVRTHKVTSKWQVGSNDLQGLAVDTDRGLLFVAGADHVISLDTRQDGKVLDSLPTGAGLDDIDFSGDQKLLYAAAAVTATLSIIEVSHDGTFRLKALVSTTKGVRGVVSAKDNTAYLIDPAQARILKLSHEQHHETKTR